MYEGEDSKVEEEEEEETEKGLWSEGEGNSKVGREALGYKGLRGYGRQRDQGKSGLLGESGGWRVNLLAGGLAF